MADCRFRMTVPSERPGAVNNGCSVDEIRQAMTIVGAYAGIPAGVEGIRSAEAVLKERGLL